MILLCFVEQVFTLAGQRRKEAENPKFFAWSAGEGKY